MTLPLSNGLTDIPVDGDPRQIRNDLTVIIAGLQTTIESTNEDDTRVRSRQLLKRAHLLSKRVEVVFESQKD